MLLVDRLNEVNKDIEKRKVSFVEFIFVTICFGFF